jgi:predicted lipoprotein with Yx(FWY)xxD motif
MRNHRSVVFCGAIGLSSFVAVGAGAAANAASPHGPTAHSSTTTMPANQRTVQSPTVRTVTSDVNGKSQSILINSQGLPLYYHRGDTAKKSFVSGELARLWPPLVSAHPTSNGTHGKLSAHNAVVAHQVAYNGRFLYTFIDDTARHVTGQGVNDFFVATPHLKSINTSPTVAPVTSAGNSGYGY